MTCQQTREYLFAFLDSELDAPLSIELQRHIDGCAHCASEAEIERTVRKRLTFALEALAPATPELDDALGDMLAGADVPSPANARPRRRFLWAAAAGIVIGASAWFAINDSAGSPSFVDLVVADFEHFLDEGKKLQVTSSSPATVAKWLLTKTSVAVVLPAPRVPGTALLGGRKCKIAGRPVAFAIYEIDGEPVSFLALHAEQGDLAEMNEIHFGGETYRVGRSKGCTVVARRRDALVYAAVSNLPADRLLTLMADTVHESD